ncbi:MAG: riboflavin biosynthesis protein RibF [Planctomycetes bacterium]|nr:riboflavin biosynthesis protein RibF [Planctomycetota bacterium]
MRTFHGIESLPPLASSVLTIGNFDGVHRAHRQIIDTARRLAAQAQAPVAVLTFEPHPLTVVAPERAPQRLGTPDDKLRHLAEAGADITVVVRSEPSFFNLDAEAFVETIVRPRFHPRCIVEGESFGFGRGRQGGAGTLRELAARFGCEVRIVEPVRVSLGDGEVVVSSSLIRSRLASGDVAAAAACLGRPYAMTGRVVAGHSRGKALGFPTANLSAPDQMVPGDGVYAGTGWLAGEAHPAAISIGHTPTFGGTARQIEAHLVGFTGETYGQTLRIEFRRLLRAQRKFETPGALARQLARDVDEVRRCADENTGGAGHGDARG